MANAINEKTETILAQWQTCVEMANAVSQRRDSMNNLFITLNLAMVTAISVTWDKKALLIVMAGIMFSIIWLYLIRNYKLLNEKKYGVIIALESKLPEAPFNNEWKKLQADRKYIDGTKLEYPIPITFMVIYIAAALVIVLQMVKA